MRELLDEDDGSDWHRGVVASFHRDNDEDGAVDDARAEVSSCAVASQVMVPFDHRDLLY